MIFFNFGPNLIKLITLLNKDITATVMQCGHPSKPFEIGRGCRQGDPISAYLFLIFAQVLYLMIENNKDITGIIIDGIEYKITQFADDTSLLLDGSHQSLQNALNTLEIFGSYSGLKMNKEKTKVIWIGRKKHSKDKINTTPSLNWGATSFNLLGLSYSVNLQEIVNLNYDKYILQTKNLINNWKQKEAYTTWKDYSSKNFHIKQNLSMYLHLFPLPILIS